MAEKLRSNLQTHQSELARIRKEVARISPEELDHIGIDLTDKRVETKPIKEQIEEFKNLSQSK